jgi:transketolase
LNFPSPTPIRDGFGRALEALGASNPNVVALTADLGESVRVHWFAQKFPDRFFQMGISESDMIATAAGLSFEGKIPFTSTFAAFAASLAHQVVKVTVGYNHANVKMVAGHCGVTVGGDGASHQAFEDIALTRVIPGLAVISPADANEAYNAVFAVAAHQGPVYLRLGRIPTPVVTGADKPFSIGRATVLRGGKDVGLIGTGAMTALALEAAAQLESEGTDVRVINMSTIKPLDEQTILSAARECGALVTVEEHSVIGGLGGAVAELLARQEPTPLEIVGINDTFGESGEPAEILEKYGLTASAVSEAARRVLKRCR